MSMQDPIADMLCRIRNGQQAKKNEITLGSSNLKEQLANVLKDEGYILDYRVDAHENNTKTLTLMLKYYYGRPVIEKIKRISRPGLRVYKSAKQLHPVSGFGIAILSTSQGVMTHAKAKNANIGGEVICEVA